MNLQIKVGGYRIERMEIDAALRALPGAHGAAAVPLRRPDGAVERIVAFVTFVGTGRDDARLPAALHDRKALLATRLPSYMIPFEWLACRSLPVSVNFRIDRMQLAQDYRDAHLKSQRRAYA